MKTETNNSSTRIVFMGTPNFAVASLEAIADAGYSLVAVITAPDKPAGRGQKLKSSPVKTAAIKLGIPVLQPHNLKDPEFITTLRNLQADLFVVVAFRMLPKTVWTIPLSGTFNLHASLLPDYRGAAPINWALINGEKQTGITTFFINGEIDTGHILLQEKVPVSDNMSAGELHDILMDKGAKLCVNTIESIVQHNIHPQPQQNLPVDKIKPAPKIEKNDCRIDWSRPAVEIHNLVRGLSPYPASWTSFKTSHNTILNAKIFSVKIASESNLRPGEVNTNDQYQLLIGTDDKNIEIVSFQVEGKKPMTPNAFLRGFRGQLIQAE